MKRSGVTMSPEPVIVSVFVLLSYSQVMSSPQTPSFVSAPAFGRPFAPQPNRFSSIVNTPSSVRTRLT